MTTEIEKARQARRSLESIQERLQNPTVEAMDSCARDMNATLACLRHVEGSLRAGEHANPVALARELSALRQDLARIQALVASAGRFYRGLARLLTAADDGGANYARRHAAGPVLVVGQAAVGHSKVVLDG